MADSGGWQASFLVLQWMAERRVFFAGVVFGATGLAGVMVSFPESLRRGLLVMIPLTVLSAGLVGAGLFRLLVARRESTVRAVVAGALVGLLVHPVAWYLGMMYLYVTEGAQEIPKLNPITGLLTAFMLGFFSLLRAGWITVPLGGLAGLLLAWLLRRFPLGLD